MFYFKDPTRPDRPASTDPVQAELERRILFAPPGPLKGPIPTYAQVRDKLAELAERGAVSARALMLSEAGFGPPVHVVVVHDLDGGVERIKPAGTVIQPQPSSAEAEQFRALEGAVFDLENVECDRKHTAGEVLPNSAATDVEIVDVWETAISPLAAEIHGATHLVGKSGTSPQLHLKLQRPRRQSKANPDSISNTGSKPNTKPKADSKSKSKAKATARAKARIKAAAKAKAKSKPKRERKKTISPDERALAELCFFMAEALGCPFNMKADLNPGLDHLDVEERIAFCLKIVKNLRAYARRRREARGMPESWWPDVWGWVRESDPWTNLKEHLHLVFYAPEDERQRMVKLMENKRKATDPKVKKWCENAKFALIDSFEHWTGWKFESALGYFVKMANPQDYSHDSTIGYKRSGFIAGPRIRFSPFLTDPDRVEAMRIDVQALKQIRDNNRVLMRRSGSEPADDPRSLLRAARSAPADVYAEIVPVEVPAAALSARVLAAAVKPETINLTRIEHAIYPGSGLVGPVHRDEAEHREMDVVEIEVQPAVSTRVPRELDRQSALIDASARVEVEVHAEDAAPPLPDVGLAPATAIPATVVSPVSPGSAEPSPSSSSPKAVLTSLAMLGRSMARTVMASAGWISSRLGSPSPPHTPQAKAARRPPVPLFDPPSFIAAGAFLGAPDIRPDPW